MNHSRPIYPLATLLLAFTWQTAVPIHVIAQDTPQGTANANASPSTDILTPAEWKTVDTSVERALVWLASKQQRNGSFPTLPQGQPGVTSLCVMAFAAHGHVPGEGPYGAQLLKAVDYIASCQKQNGLVTLIGPRGQNISSGVQSEIAGTAVYNHSISSLVLSEIFSVSSSEQTERLQQVIEKSLQVSLQMLTWPKREVDRGGWRYLSPAHGVHSDLSITGWQLMFLRSAKNSGFDVDQKPIDEAVAFVRRCFNPKAGTFEYTVKNAEPPGHGMAGAGVLALAHAGFHNSTEAQKAGDWILKHPFEMRNGPQSFVLTNHHPKRFYYGAFNCCQAMYQLGGPHWKQFFPPAVKTLLAHQRKNGSWPVEIHSAERKFGNAYTTSLMVLSLGAPNQLLPIFQR